MDFIDIVLAGLLGFSAYKGFKNGLFVELASLISFFIGVYIAVKFSYVVGAFIGELIYNSQDKKGALKAAFGAFLGFLVSSFMKFMLCFSFLILFLIVAIKNY